MASKSKRARQAAAAKSKSILPVLVWSLVAALLGYLQNRHGQFSDIRGFYGMRFMDGLHHWPYDSYIPAGATTALNPIEYPAVTGMVVWLLTFFVPATSNPIFSYFAINAFVNAILFMGTAYFVRKLTDNKHTYLYILAPAVVMALNLNWDLWAMLPMIAGLYYFERKKYNLSAFLLGLSIAAKFFPIVLLLPIFIYMMRSKDFKLFLRYAGLTTLSWLVFNLPVLLSSFKGWGYFYSFSFSRGLGDGSIYSLINKVGINVEFSSTAYYAPNILLFSCLIIFLFKSKNRIPLSISAFLTMFIFTYFGKQYSMQYILWLSPLAIICINRIQNDGKYRLIKFYLIWQVSELVFRLTYFQNMLTNVFQGTANPASPEISNLFYGSVGLIRYITAFTFLVICMKTLFKAESDEWFVRNYNSAPKKNRK